MKKFYRNRNSNRFTIEAMANCVENCTIMSGCVHCGTACCTNVANGAALVGTPSLNERFDDVLFATGSIF